MRDQRPRTGVLSPSHSIRPATALPRSASGRCGNLAGLPFSRAVAHPIPETSIGSSGLNMAARSEGLVDDEPAGYVTLENSSRYFANPETLCIFCSSTTSSMNTSSRTSQPHVMPSALAGLNPKLG